MTESVTPLTSGAHHDGDRGVGRRELDGVGEQVGEHLEQAVGVGGDLHLGGVVDELHAGRVGHRLHAVDGLANDLGQLHGAEGEGLAAALDALQIENVVDEADQPVGVGEGDAQQVGALSLTLPRMPEESRPSAPRMEVSGVRSSWLTVEMNSSLRRSSA